MLTEKFHRMLVDENQNPCTGISENPQDLSLLSVEDVGNVLRCLNMHDYVELFANEMIDGAILKGLDLDNFKAINVNLFHAKKLLKFIGVYDKLSQSPPEDSATTAEDDYVEIGIVEKNMYENTDLEKKKNTADNQDDFNSALTECSINQASFNQPEINSRHSNIYEEVIPPWNSNFKQEFVDPNLILNEQLSELHSGYVIPMISPNLQPQTKKFEAHKRTDAKKKSSDSHENVECEMDKYVYEDMDPKFERDSDSRKFERSENCKSHEDIIPQTASNVKFEGTSETKFETQPYAVTQVR